MMTLADELFKQKGQTVRLTFGQPIPASIFNKKNLFAEAQQLKDFVYQLESNPNATFTLR